MSSIGKPARGDRRGLRSMGLLVIVGVVLGPRSAAWAQLTPPRVVAPAPRGGRPHPIAAAVPPAVVVPPANVKLTLDAPTATGRWTMRVANEGSVPVRIVADARFLSLELTRRGEKRAEHCELPSAMRPDDATDRSLVLPAGRAYVETFEPRLYCFSGNAFKALAPTSIVVGHLGWQAKGSTDWEVSPIDGVEPTVAPLRHLDSAPIFLYDEKLSSAQGAPEKGNSLALALDGPQSVDADSPDEVAVSVTLRNTGSRPLRVRFRPDTMGFDVVGPSGREPCAWPRRPAAPTPELFTRLPPGGTTQMAFELAAFCGDSLDREGLLVVRPWLDTRAASGQEMGAAAFRGWVSAAAPTFVRLQRGRQPQTRVAPHLAPE
jgi:hypothetical protein